MSYQACAWANKTKTGSPSGKAVIMAIANYAGEFGESHPSVATLASDSEQSEASVRRRLHELEEAGLIARFERARENGSQTSNEIVLLFSDEAKDYARKLGWSGGALADCKGGALADCKGDPCTGESPPLAMVQPPEQSMNSHMNLPLTPKGEREGKEGLSEEGKASRPSSDDEAWSRFEAAWTFGLGESPSDARKAFGRLIVADREAAISGASAFKAAMAMSGRKHPPHAAKYLKDRMWTALQRSAGQPTGAPPAGVPKGLPKGVFEQPDGKFRLMPGTPQLERWHEYERRLYGKVTAGLTRPTQWPPSFKAKDASGGAADGLRA